VSLTRLRSPAGRFLFVGRDMNVGIIGLPQTGKKTLFRLLVGEGALPPHADPRQTYRGVAEVQDPRFDELLDVYQPRKQTRARLEVQLLPKIEEDAIQKGAIFRDMGEVEALCHVVRVFEDDAIYHMWGNPDPVRAIEFVRSELVLHDLLFVEKRLERLEVDLKKFKDEKRQREKALLERFKSQLEDEKPLRLLDVTREERVLISSFPFLTLRQMIIALNVSESQVGDESLLHDLEERFSGLGLLFVQIAAQAEAEIRLLESEEDRRDFMEEMGLPDTALHLLTAKFIEAVGLISFFTAAHNELRQWFVRRGALAPEAAGKIHGDMERGFIRAEVVHYEDVIQYGSEDGAKAAGKYHVKGKDYQIQDGDVLKILFNV
jgi:GTP-binding protein YchF